MSDELVRHSKSNQPNEVMRDMDHMAWIRQLSMSGATTLTPPVAGSPVVWFDRRVMRPDFCPNARLQRLYYSTPDGSEQPPFPIRHEMPVPILASSVDEAEPEAAAAQPTATPILPIAPFFLLDLFLAKANRAALMGDIEEDFRARLPKYGPKGACLWLWGETVRTIATRNPICRLILVGGLTRLVGWLFRQIGS